MLKGFLLIAIALVFAIWWWRRSYKPSPLEIHYADLEHKQQIGNLAQLAAFATPPPAAMVGEGWGTTFVLSNNNIGYNRPGKTRLNMRFVQPTSGGSGLPRGSTLV
jgi:hypothetical protein